MWIRAAPLAHAGAVAHRRRVGFETGQRGLHRRGLLRVRRTGLGLREVGAQVVQGAVGDGLAQPTEEVPRRRRRVAEDRLDRAGSRDVVERLLFDLADHPRLRTVAPIDFARGGGQARARPHERVADLAPHWFEHQQQEDQLALVPGGIAADRVDHRLDVALLLLGALHGVHPAPVLQQGAESLAVRELLQALVPLDQRARLRVAGGELRAASGDERQLAAVADRRRVLVGEFFADPSSAALQVRPPAIVDGVVKAHGHDLQVERRPARPASHPPERAASLVPPGLGA
jgi:hypothetical protein